MASQSLEDRPLQVVTICGEVIVFGDGVEYVLSPEAAEETSRRLASTAAIARLQTQAGFGFPCPPADQLVASN